MFRFKSHRRKKHLDDEEKKTANKSKRFFRSKMLKKGVGTTRGASTSPTTTDPSLSTICSSVNDTQVVVPVVVPAPTPAPTPPAFTAPSKNLPAISLQRALAAAMAPERETDLHAVKSKSCLVQGEDLERLYTVPENLKVLEDGGCLFCFLCNHELSPYEAAMVDAFVNLSAFDNEEQDNYVPHFEYNDYIHQKKLQLQPQQHPKYTFLVARCAYLLTGVNLQQLLDNPQIITSTEYQRSCQPEGTKVWDKIPDPDTFRITKPIIPFIYSFTVQFRVSRVQNLAHLQQLSQVLNIPIHGAIVLERTKRSKPPKQDATRKIKSILAYTDLGQGVVLVSHMTIMLQVGLPDVIERIIGTIGKWGLGETAETAWRTRRYLQSKIPFSSSTTPTTTSSSIERGLRTTHSDTPTQERKVSSKDNVVDDDTTVNKKQSAAIIRPSGTTTRMATNLVVGIRRAAVVAAVAVLFMLVKKTVSFTWIPPPSPVKAPFCPDPTAIPSVVLSHPTNVPINT